MTEGSDRAYPVVISDRGHEYGLTKRECFAAMAMQGILSNANWNPEQINVPIVVGRAARLYADELITALNEEVK